VTLERAFQRPSPLPRDLKINLPFSPADMGGFPEMLGKKTFPGQLIECRVQGVVKVFFSADFLDL
jgi:hypothetical protein